MHTVTDVLVIGGGIIGCAIAQRLAQRKIRICTVFEWPPPAGQASAASGAMLCVFSEVTPSHDIARQDLELTYHVSARKLYDDWLCELREAGTPQLSLVPGLFVIANARGDNDLIEIDAIRNAASRFESTTENVRPSDITGLRPASKYPCSQAIYLPDEGSVDSEILLTSLNTYLKHHSSVTMLSGTVASLHIDSSQVTATLADGHIVIADRVVLCCGAAAQHLLTSSSLASANVPALLSGRGTSLVVRTSTAFPTPIRTPNRGFACGVHVVPRMNGHVYLGATNRLSTAPDFTATPRLSELSALTYGVVHEISTSLVDAEVITSRVGHRPVTIDKIPLVGRTWEERVLIASGTYRNGMLLSPLIANLIADEIMHPGSTDDHHYSPRRTVRSGTPDDVNTWLLSMSRSLVASLSELGGVLPYGRDRDLQEFIAAALRPFLDDSYDPRRLAKVAQRLLRQAPAEESVPLLFELVSKDFRT